MQDPNDKIQRSLFKIAAWVIGIIILLVAGGVFGTKYYREWQERRLVAEANALVNEGNLKRASLDARRILQINPDSVEGCRIMARLAEATSSRVALDWQRRVVDLGEGKAEDVIALARSAIRFGDKGQLDFALKKLPEQAKSSAAYHSLAADLAQAKNDSAGVAQHAAEAARLEPTNSAYVLRLATLQLASNDAARRAEGKQAFARLQSEPATRREALRRLTIDSLQHGEIDQAVTLGRQLDALPEKTFNDRLLLLSALHGSADPAATPMLEELKVAAIEDSDYAAALISWFNGNGMPAAAIGWATLLPPNILSEKAVPIALSDSYITAGDWAGMRRLVNSGNWGSVDFLRNALAARASRELADESGATTQWNEALQKVSAVPKQAVTLAEVVQKWGWRDQAIELLWIAAKDPVGGDDALQALYNYFAKNGPTQDLYRVLLHRQELRPNDRDVQNNVAQLSLLLNLSADRAQRTARELYESQPTNAAYASTYAFALHTMGDSKKAEKVLGAVGPDQLHRPEFAAYYGIILAGMGDYARAAEYLDLGEKAGLLPEEKALLEKARRTVARR